jgi:hypothetical protein
MLREHGTDVLRKRGRRESDAKASWAGVRAAQLLQPLQPA